MLPQGGKSLCVIVYNWKSKNKENKQNISSLSAYVDINKTIFVILLKYLVVWWKKSLYFNGTNIFMKQFYLPNSLTSYFLSEMESTRCSSSMNILLTLHICASVNMMLRTVPFINGKLILSHPFSIVTFSGHLGCPKIL